MYVRVCVCVAQRAFSSFLSYSFIVDLFPWSVSSSVNALSNEPQDWQEMLSPCSPLVFMCLGGCLGGCTRALRLVLYFCNKGLTNRVGGSGKETFGGKFLGEWVRGRGHGQQQTEKVLSFVGVSRLVYENEPNIDGYDGIISWMMDVRPSMGKKKRKRSAGSLGKK